MEKYCEVVLIGAGAAGLLCGSLLAEQGIPVTILEKNKRVGRKLSATGNGRCNFTNLHMNENCYYGDAAWIQSVLQQIGPQRVIQLFEHYGIWHREKNGYVYPHTNQASTVVDLLVRACREQQVTILTECAVKTVEQKENGNFYVRTVKDSFQCRYLILATGGKAGKETGGDGSGYLLARRLGHTVTPIYPALTGLICQGDFWPKAAGTRIQGRFSLEIDGKRLEGEEGEIQIVKNGVSGIPVFQLCRMAAEAIAQGRQVEGIIDFVPSIQEKMVEEWIAHHGLAGILPGKWIPIASQTADAISFVKNFRFPVRDTFGIDRAQVTAGGVLLEQVNAETMESRIHKNLFILGELLDVDGKCGGYNLHLAWSTAMIASEEIRRRKSENHASSITMQTALAGCFHRKTKAESQQDVKTATGGTDRF